MKLGDRKVYTLAYADDVAVLAEDEEGMRGMMAKLDKYMDGKGLEVNIGKTKIMRCRRGGGEMEKGDLEVEGQGAGGSREVYVPRVHGDEKWGAGGSHRGEGKEGGGGDGTGVGYRKEEIWEGLG